MGTNGKLRRTAQSGTFLGPRKMLYLVFLNATVLPFSELNSVTFSSLAKPCNKQEKLPMLFSEFFG